MKEKERESPLRVEVLKRCFYLDNLPIFQKVNELIELRTSHQPPSKTSNPDNSSSIDYPPGLNRRSKHSDETLSQETFSQEVSSQKTYTQEHSTQETSTEEIFSQETSCQESLTNAYGEHKTILDFTESAITAMPPSTLTEALEISLRKHRAINTDLSSIPESLKKIDKVIREPTVKTSTKVARILRPVIKQIDKIMIDFDIYDDMCIDILGPTSPHADEAADTTDKDKEEEGGCDEGVGESMKLDAPVDHDSIQANCGAKEIDNSAHSGQRDSVHPTHVDLTTAHTTAAAGEDSAIDPSLTTKPSLTTSEAETEAITRLITLNDAYNFLQHNLLHKLKAFDKAMTETLTKPAAGVRAELVRVRWDEVVGEWRAGFVRFWVGAGGHVGDLKG